MITSLISDSEAGLTSSTSFLKQLKNQRIYVPDLSLPSSTLSQ